MGKKRVVIESVEEVLSAANAAYDKEKKRAPNLHSESDRVHFVHGWLIAAYEGLYDKINSQQV